MNKEILRKVYLDKRMMMSREEWDRRNSLLVKHFLERVDLENIKCIHVFLPMLSRNEPDTYRLVKALRGRGLRIAVSRAIWKDRSLQHFEFDGEYQLEISRLGIPEPVSGKAIFNVEIDLTLVPLIAFDREGQRIGYGGGFYDRFLSSLAPHCRKIGYTLAMPLDRITIADEWDVRMDGCVYPYGYLNFT